MTISPFTKPGTEVVCVDPRLMRLAGYLSPLRKGEIYIVREIVEHPDGGEFGCYLAGVANMVHPTFGIEIGYGLWHFRHLDLAGLDALLTERRDLPLELERCE